VQKIKFVGVVVFEKKRFEAIVDGNTYMFLPLIIFDNHLHANVRRAKIVRAK
jgi:hypothetical protein